MNIRDFQFNMFAVNTYVIWDSSTGEGAIVDPGMTSRHDCETIDHFIKDNNIGIKYLLNTHLHLDHTLGNEYIEETYNVKAHANIEDSFLGKNRAAQARMFGLNIPAPAPLEIQHNISDSTRLYLSHEEIDVIHVPGHSPGSVSFYFPESDFVITGDALFCNGIGRSDLPGGNHKDLVTSIISKLFTLPANTIVYPGHGPSTTIGYEKQHNPYL